MSDPARQRLREALASFLTEEEVRSLVEETLSISKRVSTQCHNCGKMTTGEIRDARSVSQALSSLLETAVGRLGVQSPDGGSGPTVFVRKVVYACGCGKECADCTRAEGEHAGYVWPPKDGSSVEWLDGDALREVVED